MLIFVFAVAALGCLVVSIVRNVEILSYVSVGLCACGLLVFGLETLIRNRRTVGTEADAPEPADASAADEATEADAPSSAAAETENAPAESGTGTAEPGVVDAAEETDRPRFDVALGTDLSTTPDADDDIVHVLAGRHRYHAPGCRLLDGKDYDTLDLGEATDEGFTPCTVCCAGRTAARNEETIGSTNHRRNGRLSASRQS